MAWGGVGVAGTAATKKKKFGRLGHHHRFEWVFEVAGVAAELGHLLNRGINPQNTDHVIFRNYAGSRDVNCVIIIIIIDLFRRAPKEL